MLSVIIPTLNSERELQALLTALVPAAVDGLVRDVIAADGGSTDATLEICEDAGVAVVAGLTDAVALARNEQLLVLPPSLRLRRGWTDSLRDHVERRGGSALLLEGTPTLLQRLRAPGLAGVLVARAEARRIGAKDMAGLRRGLGGRLTRLS
jgi:glycosyltransferase involved in cell wall biosynthesis